MSAFAFAVRGLVRQPGRALLGVIGIAASGALLLDMLMLSRGLVVSMDRLLESTGFDVRVTATAALPPAGPRIAGADALAASIRALPQVEDVVPIRLEQGSLEMNGRRVQPITLLGAHIAGRRPWTLLAGTDLDAGSAGRGAEPLLVVNRTLWDELRLSRGARVVMRGDCRGGASAPPVAFQVTGVAEFPFDEASENTAVATLGDVARACGDSSGEADLLMIVSDTRHGPDAAAHAVRRARPDLTAVTNEELVDRFQQVEFSYFRQISVVLASITLFFGALLIAVLLSVSTNQRLGEIAVLRALGFSTRRMAADVLWRSAILVGVGGVAAMPLGVALAVWLEQLLKAMPGIPANVHFFVYEQRTFLTHVGLLALTTLAAAAYPIRLVVRLPIAATLRNEVIG